MAVQIDWRKMTPHDKRQAVIRQLRLMSPDGQTAPQKSVWDASKPVGWTPANNFPKLFGMSYLEVATRLAQLQPAKSRRWDKDWSDVSDIKKLADGHHNPPVQPIQVVAGGVVGEKRFWHTGLLRWVTMPVRVGGFA